MKKKVYKFKKYSKRKVFRGDQSILANLFCLATPEYCSLFKSLNGNLKKLIKNIANIPGTELENFTILEVKNKIVGFVMGAWFLSISIGNKMAGWIGSLTASESVAEGAHPTETLSVYADTYLTWGVFVVAGATLILLLLVPTLRKWMHGIH